jgi:hypothetical protein
MGEQMNLAFAETSRDALASIDMTALEQVVLSMITSFGHRGAISDQIRMALPHLGYSSVTARYKRLVDSGQIEIIGTRKGLAGRAQRVYRSAYVTKDIHHA